MHIHPWTVHHAHAAEVIDGQLFYIEPDGSKHSSTLPQCLQSLQDAAVTVACSLFEHRGDVGHAVLTTFSKSLPKVTLASVWEVLRSAGLLFVGHGKRRVPVLAANVSAACSRWSWAARAAKRLPAAVCTTAAEPPAAAAERRIPLPAPWCGPLLKSGVFIPSAVVCHQACTCSAQKSTFAIVPWYFGSLRCISWNTCQRWTVCLLCKHMAEAGNVLVMQACNISEGSSWGVQTVG